MKRPLIGVTADVLGENYTLARGYVSALREAGARAVVLPPSTGEVQWIDALDGVLFSGGDDPSMEAFGAPTHPSAKLMAAERQSGELALLAFVRAHAEIPVLGVCLGMQLMALAAGGRLIQHLPDVLPTAANHAKDKEHPVMGALGAGLVTSNHHQAVGDPGTLTVTALADDGVIEAVSDFTRPYFVGVQWHPERTKDPRLGSGILREFVAAAGRSR